MGNQKWTAAVIGCGAAANQEHIPALQAIAGVEIVAVCDVDASRAEQVAFRWSIPSAYGDVAELLRSESLDLVHIATNPESHLELTLAAMDAGAHVLVEKPFVFSSAEANEAIERGRATGKRFTVIHNDVFMPSFLQLKRRIEAGEIGTLTSVQFISSLRDQRRIAKPWFYESYGGRMGETLPHAYCALVDLLDDLEIVHVEARSLGHSLTPEGVDPQQAGIDELRVELVSETAGAMASIHYGFNSHFPDSLLVCGTEGHLMAHSLGGVTPIPRRLQLGDSLTVLQNKLSRRLRRLGAGGAKRAAGESSQRRQIAAWIEHLREGAPYPVSEAKAGEVVALWEQTVRAYSG